MRNDGFWVQCFFWGEGDKNVLRLDGCDGCTTLEYIKTTELYT